MDRAEQGKREQYLTVPDLWLAPGRGKPVLAPDFDDFPAAYNDNFPRVLETLHRSHAAAAVSRECDAFHSSAMHELWQPYPHNSYVKRAPFRQMPVV